ncbi:hypothetical protein GCM10022247_18060 [Allokutzneria multivorans]|uniref:Uncharacterized protein n=1 Tax=Allokutzneria multivorans TaxID=1142134 RepID=A0ABP7RJ48_9PSEU
MQQHIPTSLWIDYNNAPGPEKAQRVRRHRHMHENTNVWAIRYNIDLLDAIQAGRRSGDDLSELITAIDNAHPKKLRSYEENAEGWCSLVQDWKPELTDVGIGECVFDDVRVRVRPHLGLVDGKHRYATYLWFKDEPLTEAAACSVLRLMQLEMPAILPGGRPLVIDVRRSRLMHLPRKRQWRDFDEWLAREATAYGEYWRAAPVAA